jgi:hypothetical protein
MRLDQDPCEHRIVFSGLGDDFDCSCGHWDGEGAIEDHVRPLDAAWVDAEAAKPEGWYGPLVTPQYDDNSEWMALVASGMQGDGSPGYPQLSATGPSPTLALRTLTERLRSERQT